MNAPVTFTHLNAGDQPPRGISSGFPTDLLLQSAERLRVLALLYAFTFFMAGVVPALLIPADRARFFGSVLQWGPATLGIGTALVLAAVIGSARFPLSLVMNIGLAFEIASSYAIAAGEYARRSAMLTAIEALEGESAMLGVSAHLLAIARRG